MNKKASILLVLKILEEYTDANHYLTQVEIAEKVKEVYDLELERKSVGSSLAILESLDFDIVRGPRGGVALISRALDPSEVKFLVDAIFSSKSIAGPHARDLSTKIYKSLSRYDRKNFEYVVKSEDLTRTENKQVFLNVEIIEEAIRQNKWVGFKYLSYDDNGEQVENYNGYIYHASPCYLVNNYGHYYLLAYRYKYDSVNVWRVDKMKDVYVMEERDRLEPKELKEFKDYSNISEYLNDHIYLFDGPAISAVVELDNSKAISHVVDWFGDNASIYKEGDKLRARIKCNETAFYYWMLQYSGLFKLISPQSMVEKIIKAADAIKEKYA